MFNRLSMLVLLLGIASVGHAGDAINRFLAAAQNSLSAQPLVVATETAWFEDSELRYSGSDDDEHGIAFRFRPRFETERQAEHRILELLNEQYAGALDGQLNDALKHRYIRLIDLVETYNESRYFGARQQLGEQRLAHNRSLVQTEDFRIDDLQAAEFNFHSERQQARRLDKKLEHRLRGFIDVPRAELENFLASWRENVIDQQSIGDSGSLLQQLADTQQLTSRTDQLDYQLAQQKLRLARGTSANWLNFIELKFIDRPTGEQETSLSLAIPLGKSSFGLSQRSADLNRAQLSLQRNQSEMVSVISDFALDLQWLQDQELALQSDLILLEQQYSRLRSNAQPVILLKLKSEILRYQNERRRNHIRLLRRYIELLHVAGYLARKPLTNWLLGSRPEF